jgi:hypothetical protein
MTQISRSLLVLSMLMSPIACGGEDDDKGGGGSTTVESGVDTAKPLNMLTQEEVTQLNESYTASLSSQKVIDAMCNFAGVFATAFPVMEGEMMGPTCEEVVSQCKQAAAMNPAAASQGTAATLPATNTAFAQCNVTVGELEACLTASVEMLATVFGSLMCGADPSMMQNVDVSTAELTECQTLNAMCPTVVAGSGGVPTDDAEL